MMKVTDSDDGVFLPELQKVQSLPLWAFAFFGGRALYADPTVMAQISAGDRRTVPGTNRRVSPTLRGSSCPLTVCGTQWELVEDLNAIDGGSHIVRLNLTRESQGNLLGSNIICQPGTVQSTMGPAQAYTASPGHFVVQVKSANGTRVDSFVKL